MACFGGEGSVLVEGVWKSLGDGEDCLLPPFVQNAFRCREDAPWECCWVRYLESREQKPIVSQNSPVLQAYDYAPMKAATEAGRWAYEAGRIPKKLYANGAEYLHTKDALNNNDKLSVPYDTNV